MKLSKPGINALMATIVIACCMSALVNGVRVQSSTPAPAVEVAAKPVKSQAQVKYEAQMEALENGLKEADGTYNRMMTINMRNLVNCEAITNRTCAIDAEGQADMQKQQLEVVAAYEAIEAYKATGEMPNPCGEGVDCD